MKPIAGLLLAAGALFALGAAGAGKGAGKAPQRTPTKPPPLPPPPTSEPVSQQGAQVNNDQGRTWKTIYVNRDAVKKFKIKILTVASDASNPDVGTGELIADVFESIDASQIDAGEEWSGVACGARRWRLNFEAGRLVSYFDLSLVGGIPQPSCVTVRPIAQTWLRTMRWSQSGRDVFLEIDTASGIDRGTIQNPFAGPNDWRWDNKFVASGYALIDVAWVFNPG